MIFLTIFTPTYNRANTIARTYESLCKQTCMNFEWLVVDDGSTDNTESLVSEWMKDSIFPIRYIKQSNGGKYRAYNKGLELAEGEFFFCVDSDDWLPSNSVELISQYADILKQTETLAGLVALKSYQDANIIGQPYKEPGKHSSLYHLELSGEGGERSLVFKTSVARLFYFPLETNEHFITESVIYDRFEGKYDFIICNDILTICEYQENGLSSGNPHSLMLRYPAGYKLYFAQRIDMTPYFLERVTYAIRYHVFRILYAGPEYNYNGKYRTLVSILSSLGFIAKFYYTRAK